MSVLLSTFAAQTIVPLPVIFRSDIPVLAGTVAVGAILPLLLLTTWQGRAAGAMAVALGGAPFALIAAEGLAHVALNTCLQ